MYPEYLVAPMREDLTRVGFEELKDAEAVKQAIESEGTVVELIFPDPNNAPPAEGRSI